MLAGRELGLSAQSHVPLLKELKDGEESHLVFRVGGGFQEFSRGNRVLRADSAHEPQRRKQLVLRQQNWDVEGEKGAFIRRTSST